MGTFYESNMGSHEKALWIYDHIFFQALLIGYFINILLSALRRFPFKKQHIPFLITHLGLLMIISGIFFKNIFGIQSHMMLLEGSSTSEVLLDNKKAVIAETVKGLTVVDEKNIKKIAPHAEERYISWDLEDLKGLSFPVWKEISNSIDDFYIPKTPNLFIHQIPDGMTTLVLTDALGIEERKTYDSNQLDRYLALNDGFSGYSVSFDAPFSTLEDQDKINAILTQELTNAREVAPPLSLLKQIASADEIIAYLRSWKNQGTYLFDKKPDWLAYLSWESLSSSEKKGLFWIATLYAEKDFITHLKKNGWPLIESLEKIDNQQLPKNEKNKLIYEAWEEQIFAVVEHLPDIEIIPESLYPKMLSAYLRRFHLHLDNIPLPKNYSPSDTIYLESPIHRKIITLSEPKKMEELTPLIEVDWEGEKVPLIFDPKGTKMKWPHKNQKVKFRFQPMPFTLPYEVRLHKALDIKYPNSPNSLSYECHLSLKERSTGIITSCLLRMNQVHETTDGFRFYLSGMSIIDPYGVRMVHLVVSKDPVKAYLTYPGALLVGLGILLLFFGNRKKIS